MAAVSQFFLQASAMGLNYAIGSRLGRVRDMILQRRPPVVFDRFPRGRIMEADLLRILDDEHRVVFDIGANVGQTAVRFSKWFPRADIYSFEPVPDNYARLVNRTSGLPAVRTYPWACGAAVGTFAMNLGEDSERHTLAARTGASTVDVQVTTIDAFCVEHDIQRIDLLKSDTEGFETEVLRGCFEMLARGAIRSIYIEVGVNGQTNHTPFAEVLAILKPAGFDFSGFYEPYRCGARKEVVWFCNALFVKSVR
jgi:FkbM family methyltransferase